MYAGESRGFTVIELLIVMLIIGILAAIAIPMFIGQKDKASYATMQSSTRSIEKELSLILQDYSNQAPIIFSSALVPQGCYEHSAAEGSLKCSAAFEDLPMAGTYDNIEDIITLFLEHHNNGLLTTNPYNGGPLLTSDNTPASRDGHVLLVNTSDRRIQISAWNPYGGMISNSFISSR